MSIKIGVVLPQFPEGMPPAALLTARARQVESLGFDSFWVGDRLLTPSGIPDPVSFLGYLAAVTERIRIGSGVLLLPLRPPAQVAKVAATIDYLSGGRFILGVAPGGDFANEFEACDVPIKQRGGRTEEGVILMRRLWREENVDHEGRYYRLRGGTIHPRPVQSGGPPVWIGGRGDWAVRCAGLIGDAWCPSFMPPKRYAESCRRVLDLAQSAGRDPAAIVPAVNVVYYLGSSFDAAFRAAASVLGASYGRSYDPAFFKKLAIVGSADDCRAMVAQLAEAGVRHVVLMPACHSEEMEEQLERAAEELLPLRERL